MTLRYLSVCSGIEAASVAWHPLGWTPAAFAEIETFPRAVLQHRWPSVPLHGDFTTIKGDEYGPVDVLVGGTPCQSFSVAGLRGGLADDRGNLALEFLRLAQRARPKWLVWENVPGVLSSGGGRDFGSILGGLVELGYGFAYRVLDAQYFGVPQTRRRVFVIGCAGDWRRAAAVLFERHSLQGHPAPSRKAGEGIAPTIASRPSGGGGLGTDFDCDGGLVANTLSAARGKASAHDASLETYVAFQNTGQGWWKEGAVACAIRTPDEGSGSLEASVVARCDTARHTRLDWETENFVAHSLRADGFDASEDGTGRGTPLVAFAENSRSELRLEGGDGATVSALKTGGGKPGQSYPAIAFGAQMSTPHWQRDQSDTLQAKNPKAIASGANVRRLTPRECERLQGFPDDYTLIPYRGKSAADGPRYKALGNSMAVPVMRWIGQRIIQSEAA